MGKTDKIITITKVRPFFSYVITAICSDITCQSVKVTLSYHQKDNKFLFPWLVS